jgi:4'-phosphopantetheinyl transferase
MPIIGPSGEIMTRQGNHSTCDFSWRPGPRHPSLARGALHVWRADLAMVSDEVLAALSPDEHARAERLLNRRKGRLWARSRGVLRVILGSYLSEDPRALSFGTGTHGKPVLAAGDGRSATLGTSWSEFRPQLHFNVSHYQRLVVYAFSRSSPVGVDVQVPSRAIDVVALASRAFGPAEGRRLEALADGVREHEFMRAWTRYEAVLKWTGTGIGGIINSQEDRRPREPWLFDLDLGRGTVGAVALEGSPHELRCWDWDHHHAGHVARLIASA